MAGLRTYLDKPLKELPLSDGVLRRAEKALYGDLARVGLPCLFPKLYWSTEWFTPDGSSTIAVPFYLSNPKLSIFAKKHGMYVEGQTRASFKKILLHEAGHCFEHVYSLRHKKRFKALFGNWQERVKPFATKDQGCLADYVSVVSKGYGSKHPLEDFAETFAYVCLQRLRLKPNSKTLSKTQQRKVDYAAGEIQKASKRRRLPEADFYFDAQAKRVGRTLRQVL